jgi:predicted DsbA family dithiol-disulfide isomerase
MSFCKIHIVVDFNCPWSYLGYSKAIASSDALDHDVIFIPETRILFPNLPYHGEDRVSFLANRLGNEARVHALDDAYLDACDDMDFHIPELPDFLAGTEAAHLLVHILRNDQSYELANYACQRIFDTYFMAHNTAIFKPSHLLQLAKDIGASAQQIQKFCDLSSGDFKKDIHKMSTKLNRRILCGIPCFIVDGRFIISGVQNTTVLNRLISTSKSLKRLNENNIGLYS